MADLTVNITGIKMRNPVMLASGVFGETGESLLRAAKGGAGAVVTKSIGREPRDGHPNPTVVEFKYGSMLNSMGLPNPGIKAYSHEMEFITSYDIPVIGSIFGKNAREFVTLAKYMERYGAYGVELNLSCPHAQGLGMQLGTDKRKVAKITKSVKNAISIPVFVKLTPNVTDSVEIAKAAEIAGADAIVAINTVKAMAIDVEFGIPMLGNKVGGLSGPAIRPIGIRAVYDISRNVKIPVIGVGGIFYGKDAVEYFMAGASAVQVATAINTRGIDVFKKITNEINDFMDSHGYSKIEDIVGISWKHLR
jgi:dihydroorotate dehydrogenase (NAD+) catalytic subunit